MNAPARLPRSVRDLVDCIGYEAALALVGAIGGQAAIKVPLSLATGTGAWLVAVMGEEAAARFVAHYQGERFAVARCAGALKDARDQQIIDAYTAGTRVNDLVVAHRLTERQIRNILKRTPGAAVLLPAPVVLQGDLFGEGAE